MFDIRNFSRFIKNWGFLIVLIAAVLTACIGSWIAHVKLISDYESKAYDENSYINGEEHRREILEIIAFCRKHKADWGEKHEYCKDAQDSIARMAGITDLVAQQTMATATRGVLYGTWFQIFIGALALAFLAITVWQSRQAAVAAWGVFDETKKANILELKPYLEIDSCEITWVSYYQGEAWIDIEMFIKNIGKSPALNISTMVITGIHFRTYPRNVTANSKETVFEMRFDAPPVFEEGTAITALSPRAKFPLTGRIKLIAVKNTIDPGFGSMRVDGTDIPGAYQTDFTIEGEIAFSDTFSNDKFSRPCRFILATGGHHSLNLRGLKLKPKDEELSHVLLEDEKCIVKYEKRKS